MISTALFSVPCDKLWSNTCHSITLILYTCIRIRFVLNSKILARPAVYKIEPVQHSNRDVFTLIYITPPYTLNVILKIHAYSLYACFRAVREKIKQLVLTFKSMGKINGFWHHITSAAVIFFFSRRPTDHVTYVLYLYYYNPSFYFGKL